MVYQCFGQLSRTQALVVFKRATAEAVSQAQSPNGILLCKGQKCHQITLCVPKIAAQLPKMRFQGYRGRHRLLMSSCSRAYIMANLLALLPFQDALFNLGCLGAAVVRAPLSHSLQPKLPPSCRKNCIAQNPRAHQVRPPSNLRTLSSNAPISSGISGLNFSKFDFVVSDLTPC